MTFVASQGCTSIANDRLFLCSVSAGLLISVLEEANDSVFLHDFAHDLHLSTNGGCCSSMPNYRVHIETATSHHNDNKIV